MLLESGLQFACVLFSGWTIMRKETECKQCLQLRPTSMNEVIMPFPWFMSERLEPVMDLVEKMSVHCIYNWPLPFGWQMYEKVIRVMSAMKSGRSAYRI